MKTLALCAGYGGLEMALRAAGQSVELAAYAEVDEAASTVMARHHPDVPNLGDIRALQVVPDVKRIAVGFPCQPISAAGAQRHREDERYLWPSVARAIEMHRPDEVFAENVQRITSIDGGSVLAEVLGDLADLGYSARWCVLGACAVGFCHHRHRWYLRAVPGTGHARVPMRACGLSRGVALPTVVARDGDAKKGRGEGDAAYWVRRREAGRTNGIPLGAALALLPTPRASDGKNGGPSQGLASGDIALSSAVMQMLPTPMANDGIGGRAEQRLNSRGSYSLSAAVIGERFAQYAPAVLRQAAQHGYPPEPTEPNSKGDPRLSPGFSEWMMGLPRGHVITDLKRVEAIRVCGNGVVPAAGAEAYRRLREAHEQS